MPRTSRRLGDLIQGINRLVPLMEHTGPNNTIAVDKDDLQPKVLETAQDYATAVTLEGGNEYPLTSIRGQTSIRNGQGFPASLEQPGQNEQVHYTQKFEVPSPDGQSAVAAFDGISNSGLLNTDSRFEIKKGKVEGDAPTGTEIFQEVNELGERSEFVQRVRQVQFDNNRFTIGKTFVPRTGLESADGLTVQTPGSDGSGSVTEDESNIGVGYVQQEFGKHGPRKFPTSEGQTATLIRLKNLKKMGLVAALQASGEYYIPNDPDDVAQQVAARGASLAPGLARVGQKIDMSRVSPINVMKHIDATYEKPSLDDNIKRDPVLSYGNVNNWMAPFAGLNSTASIACAALLTMTIGSLIKGTSTLLAPMARRSQHIADPNPEASERRKRIGSFLGKSNEVSAYRNIALELRVAQTQHDYQQCVAKGVDVFFGFTNVSSQAERTVTNHGYYNVLLRSLVRSTNDFIRLSTGVSVTPTSIKDVNDFTLPGNPLGSSEILQKLNESPLLKFCNIMAEIGDVALSHEDAGFILDQNGEVDEWISDIDRINPIADSGPNGGKSLNPGVLQSVNRLPSEYRNALAWGSNTAKSMYIFPESLIRGEALYIGSNDQSRAPSEAVMADLEAGGLHVVKGPGNTVGNRISAEAVKEMEDHLEADYLPFYFHDLRTNEIISFHAFLEDVSDSYDAQYNEVEGYGRADDVLIYKKTKRSISIGFRVVATNEKDFDHMWWKINKLITLVYPQYTEGRQIGTSTDKFIQPFSQVPSASPVIRLRLGDLFKTNYSKFAAARLFGITSTQFQLQGQNGEFTYQANLSANRERVANRMNKGEYQAGEFAMLQPQFEPGRNRRPRGYPRVGSVTDTASQPSQSTRRGRGGRRGAGNAAEQSYIPTGLDGSGLPASSTGRPLVLAYPAKVQITSVQQEGPNTFYNFTVVDGGDGQDGTYRCSKVSLRPIPGEITRVAFNQPAPTESDNATPANTPDVINQFFNPNGDDGNVILKSFESTKGRGLAGVIKSLRFDWNDSRWETGRHNSRAPMFLKISLEFAPIHDIAPGLDSNGFMNAPTYNIGDTLKAFIESPEKANENNSINQNVNRSQFPLVPRSVNGNQNGGGVS